MSLPHLRRLHRALPRHSVLHLPAHPALSLSFLRPPAPPIGAPPHQRRYAARKARPSPTVSGQARAQTREITRRSPADLLPFPFISSARSNNVLPSALTSKEIYNLLATYSVVALPYTPSQHLASNVLRAHPNRRPHDLFLISLLVTTAKFADGAEPHERTHAGGHLITSAALLGDREAAVTMYQRFQTKEADTDAQKHRVKWGSEITKLIKGHAMNIFKDIGLLSASRGVVLEGYDMKALNLDPLIEAEKERNWTPKEHEEYHLLTEEERLAKDKQITELVGKVLGCYARILISEAKSQGTKANNKDIDAILTLAGRFREGTACRLLGMRRYRRGDIQGAIDAWTRACELDDKESFFYLSTQLEPEQTFGQHEECLLTAAASGMMEAAHNLGVLYSEIRTDSNRDLVFAKEWFKVAGMEGGKMQSFMALVRLTALEGNKEDALWLLGMLESQDVEFEIDEGGAEELLENLVRDEFKPKMMGIKMNGVEVADVENKAK